MSCLVYRAPSTQAPSSRAHITWMVHWPPIPCVSARIVNRFFATCIRFAVCVRPGRASHIATSSRCARAGCGWSSQRSSTYTYDSVTGALAGVTDVLGNTFRYVYDAKGRLDSLVSPGGVREAYRYDDDDQLILRVDSATLLVGQPGGFAHGLIHCDLLIDDARGKVIEERTIVDILRFGYSALGSLVDGATMPTDSADTNGEEEFFVNDALGNRYVNWQLNTHNAIFTDSAETARIWFYHAGTARLDSADIFPSGAPPLPAQSNS